MMNQNPGWAAQAVAQGAIDLRSAIRNAAAANVKPNAEDNHGSPIGDHLRELRKEIDAYLGHEVGNG